MIPKSSARYVGISQAMIASSAKKRDLLTLIKPSNYSDEVSMMQRSRGVSNASRSLFDHPTLNCFQGFDFSTLFI